MKRILILLTAVWLMLALAWAATAAAEQPIAQATVTVQRDELNGRQSPDIHSKIVAWFQDGTVIDIYEINGDWAQTLGSEAGYCWVSINYLITRDAGSYTVAGNGRLRIRSTPDGDAVGWLKPGQTVEVQAIFGCWARIRSGWVMAAYLEANK